MCRNIKTLHNFEPPATDEEIRASAVQFVRKLSGTTRPSKANEPAFGRAVDQVAAAARELLDALVTTAPPRDRTVEVTTVPPGMPPAFAEHHTTATSEMPQKFRALHTAIGISSNP